VVAAVAAGTLLVIEMEAEDRANRDGAQPVQLTQVVGVRCRSGRCRHRVQGRGLVGRLDGEMYPKSPR
jgi:hypothetical protein